jgi:hypothetical protein
MILGRGRGCLSRVHLLPFADRVDRVYGTREISVCLQPPLGDCLLRGLPGYSSIPVPVPLRFDVLRSSDVNASDGRKYTTLHAPSTRFGGV